MDSVDQDDQLRQVRCESEDGQIQIIRDSRPQCTVIVVFIGSLKSLQEEIATVEGDDDLKVVQTL